MNVLQSGMEAKQFGFFCRVTVGQQVCHEALHGIEFFCCKGSHNGHCRATTKVPSGAELRSVQLRQVPVLQFSDQSLGHVPVAPFVKKLSQLFF